MAEIADLNINDNNNVGRFPENQTIPSINNGARALEGIIARQDRDRHGYWLTTGTATAYIITTAATYPSLTSGMVFMARFHVASGDNPTFQVNALTAKPLRRSGNRRIRPGDILVSAAQLVAYNASIDAFECVGIHPNAHLGSYAVASLPTAELVAGDIAYASNGRKNGEAASAGTGVLVFRDATAWRACDTGATVAA